jgi:hypothetical protein
MEKVLNLRYVYKCYSINDNRYIVMIIQSQKNRGKHFYIELNKNGKVIDWCYTGYLN